MALEKLSLYPGFRNVLSDPTILLKLQETISKNKIVFAMTISKAQGQTLKRVGIFYVHGSVHRESVSITVQQYATIYSFIIFLQTALRVSGDTFIHHQEHT